MPVMMMMMICLPEDFDGTATNVTIDLYAMIDDEMLQVKSKNKPIRDVEGWGCASIRTHNDVKYKTPPFFRLLLSSFCYPVIMAELPAFRTALNRIGWDVASADAFIAEGFESIGLLGVVDKDFLKSVCKTIRSCADNPVPIPALNEYCLYAMHLWVSTLQSIGQPTTADLYTPAVANTYLTKLRQATATKDEDQDLVKQPDAFTKDTTWISFERALKNWLGTKRGQNGVTLDYVISPEAAIPPAGTNFDTEHERLVRTTPLAGDAYEIDNGKVWTAIKDLTLKGPVWAYISQLENARDGRAAVLAL
jgi:hypothetical protein